MLLIASVTDLLVRNAYAKATKKNALSTQDHLKANLKWASLAVDYARSKMTLGAGNKDGNPRKNDANTCVGDIRANDKIQSKNSKDLADYISKIADDAKKHGCGNCMEQSAIAFTYLHKNRVLPLDWAYVTNGDHAFVVIQRRPKSLIDDYKTWGPVCVISDPWGNGAFPATDILLKGVYGASNKKMHYGTMARIE
jgi:hypothetical protein